MSHANRPDMYTATELLRIARSGELGEWPEEAICEALRRGEVLLPLYYRGKRLAHGTPPPQTKEPEVQYIPIRCIYGDSWLFQDQAYWAAEGKPAFPRLAACLWLTALGRTPPPLEVFSLPDGRYITGDGNHRIYTAFLLGQDRVLAEVHRLDTLPPPEAWLPADAPSLMEMLFGPKPPHH